MQSITLDFRVLTGEEEKSGPWQIDHFSKQLLVRAGQQAKVSEPLQMPAAYHSKLELSVTARDGRYLGGSTIGLTSLTKSLQRYSGGPVCQGRSACDEAQSQISFGGSEEEVLEKE